MGAGTLASWCAWRDSNPHAETPAPQAGLSTNSSTRTYGTQDGTRTHRKLILNQPRLPIAPLEHTSQDLGFLREPNTKLRRSFNTTWYSRWDSNPQHLPPEDSASAKLRHDCILRGEPARRLNCATPEVLVIQLFSGQILSRFSSWHGLLGSNQQILGQSQVFCH